MHSSVLHMPLCSFLQFTYLTLYVAALYDRKLKPRLEPNFENLSGEYEPLHKLPNIIAGVLIKGLTYLHQKLSSNDSPKDTYTVHICA